MLFFGKGHDRAIEALILACPPGPFAAAGSGIAEMVIVDNGPKEFRRLIRKRIFFKKGAHLARTLEDADAKVQKPRIVPVACERRKPHLPVHARL